jgi:CBS domain-containing protein
MIVKQILKMKGSAVFTMSPSATLADVARELTHRKIGAVVILDGERIAGIVSERDVVRAIAERGAKALEATASSVMTQRVETCACEDLVDDLLERMTNSRFRHLPVVEEGHLVGLVSIGDVVKQRIDEAVRERDHMRDYIHSM